MGRTQPTKAEVLAPKNQQRVTERFQRPDPRLVLYLGSSAEFIHSIVQEHHRQFRAFRTGHPSRRAWNTRPEYKDCPRDEKLKRWARDRFQPVP